MLEASTTAPPTPVEEGSGTGLDHRLLIFSNEEDRDNPLFNSYSQLVHPSAVWSNRNSKKEEVRGSPTMLLMTPPVLQVRIPSPCAPDVHVDAPHHDTATLPRFPPSHAWMPNAVANVCWVGVTFVAAMAITSPVAFHVDAVHLQTVDVTLWQITRTEILGLQNATVSNDFASTLFLGLCDAAEERRLDIVLIAARCAAIVSAVWPAVAAALAAIDALWLMVPKWLHILNGAACVVAVILRWVLQVLLLRLPFCGPSSLEQSGYMNVNSLTTNVLCVIGALFAVVWWPCCYPSRKVRWVQHWHWRPDASSSVDGDVSETENESETEPLDRGRRHLLRDPVLLTSVAAFVAAV